MNRKLNLNIKSAMQVSDAARWATALVVRLGDIIMLDDAFPSVLPHDLIDSKVFTFPFNLLSIE